MRRCIRLRRASFPKEFRSQKETLRCIIVQRVPSEFLTSEYPNHVGYRASGLQEARVKRLDQRDAAPAWLRLGPSEGLRQRHLLVRGVLEYIDFHIEQQFSEEH